MSTLIDPYIQNNWGIFPADLSQNAIMSEDGSFVIGYSDHWTETKTTRIVIGSDSVHYYTSTLSPWSNRDFEDIDEPGPLIHILQAPKWSNSPYIAVIAPVSNVVSNLEVYFGWLEDGFIVWEEAYNLFNDNVVSNFWASCTCCTAALLGFSSSNSTSDLIASIYDLGNQISGPYKSEDTNYYYPLGSSFTDIDGEAGVVMATRGTIDGFPEGAAYCPFSTEYRSFGTPVTLNIASSVSSGAQSELDIAFDKENGRIIILSTFFNADDDPVFKFEYELLVSDDGGSTWDIINLEDEGLLGGTEDWLWEGYYIARARIMSGAEGGFVFGYTRVNSSGYARPYVHQATFVTSGGTVNNYSIGEAKEVGNRLGSWDENTDISGPLFFKAPADMWMNIEPIKNLLFAYQIGNGIIYYSDFPQQSIKSVGLAIEELSENGYPEELSYTYSAESAGSGEIVCSLSILDTPSDYEDFFSHGYIGEYTNNVAEAFYKFGTPVLIEKYDPKDDIYVGGKSSYKEPEEYAVKCFFDSLSWDSPNQALNQADYDEFIDKDLRKIYLPPAWFQEYKANDPLAEVYNQTIYLAKFSGFTYEIRQLVPKFIENQIIYWEANCYNVGNFDVWSRGGGRA